MSSETKTTLRLLFEPPEENGISTPHERKIEKVPTSLAKQIAEDFVQQGRTSDVDRCQLYRIKEEEDERLIALDFGEVLRVASAL